MHYRRASPQHRSRRSTNHIVLIYTPAYPIDTLFYNHFLSMAGKFIVFEMLPHIKHKKRRIWHGFPEHRIRF